MPHIKVPLWKSTRTLAKRKIKMLKEHPPVPARYV
jgi:hypothetical protein